MDRVATTASDLVSRAETISESQVADILVAADQVAEAFDLADPGVVIVSSITNSDGTGPVLAWHAAGPAANSGTGRLGAPGDTPVLPDDFVISEGETAIVSEVYHDFARF
jgi:hypothetical protein